MRPVEFKHQNVVFAKDQPEYQPLPVLKIDGDEGNVISCWRLSFWERVKVLFTGRVWMKLMTFNRPLTPSLLSVNRKDLYWHVDDYNKWHVRLGDWIKGLFKATNPECDCSEPVPDDTNTYCRECGKVFDCES